MKKGEKKRVLEIQLNKLKQARTLLEEVETRLSKPEFNNPTDLLMPDEITEALNQISMPISVLEDGLAKNQW